MLNTMNDFESTFNFVSMVSNIMFIVVPVLMLLILIFGILMVVSPKLRGKMMSRQVKSIKHMTDYSKEDLEDINTNLVNVEIKSRKKILDENEETLRDMAVREAAISKEKIKVMARALKNGLSDEQIDCKHCGEKRDSSSKFCKKCGKEQ